MHPEEIKAKYMQKYVWKSFLINLQAGIVLLNYELLSSKIIFRDFDQMNTFQWPLLVPVKTAWKVQAKAFYHKY